jgi:hypothetical protein
MAKHDELYLEVIVESYVPAPISRKHGAAQVGPVSASESRLTGLVAYLIGLT